LCTSSFARTRDLSNAFSTIAEASPLRLRSQLLSLNLRDIRPFAIVGSFGPHERCRDAYKLHKPTTIDVDWKDAVYVQLRQGWSLLLLVTFDSLFCCGQLLDCWLSGVNFKYLADGAEGAEGPAARRELCLDANLNWLENDKRTLQPLLVATYSSCQQYAQRAKCSHHGT
jgi:hypothetical protein